MLPGFSEGRVSYTVLARRYRSTSFVGVIGQEPIAKTLRSAIEQGRVAHAYLFTGTRGVGKTSMARIFARALNAPVTVDDAPMPPDADADGGFPPEDVQQRMAEAIMRGDDLNVIEIDGASNNSVEQARQLIANAGLSPTGNARYKIYIIDEVHMLSISAFNALLKTMEEPPPHVKFILCTTEPHKVPATIHSRCQTFDFRNIPTPKIADHLTSVLASESVEADEQVVWQIARLANGSMRDGLSLLDRLIATGYSPLTPEVLEQMFGLPDAQLVAGLVDSLAGGDVKGSLEAVGNLIANGVSQDQVFEVLIERFRPSVMSVEDVFQGKNVRSALTLGHARGAILLAAALSDLTIAEYTPRQIKKAVVGHGGATKGQVAFMVQKQLRLQTPPTPADAADGCAAALCYCLLGDVRT